VDIQTQRKWDAASGSFDFLSFADDHRLGAYKRKLFAKIHGETLMVAAGTGNDFKVFPLGQHIIAIDISTKMLERAARKAVDYQGTIELRQMDVCELPFSDSSFDTICDGVHLLLRSQACARSPRAASRSEAERADADVRTRTQQDRSAPQLFGPDDPAFPAFWAGFEPRHSGEMCRRPAFGFAAKKTFTSIS
jgi:SAM-dependent methyltransferase